MNPIIQQREWKPCSIALLVSDVKKSFPTRHLLHFHFKRSLTMEVDENMLSLVANGIENAEFTQPALLNLINEVVNSGEGPRLAATIFSEKLKLTRTNEDAVENTMLALEALGSVSKGVACALMLHLWPVANDLYMHHVADAIELWVCDYGWDKVRPEIKRVVDAEARKHFERML